MKDYYISTKKKLLSKEKVHYLLKDLFWSKNIPIEYVERFLKYSLCFGIYQKINHELIGFGRVITDYTTYAYVCDIVIDPHHRKKGLENALVSAIKQHSDLQGLKTWALRTTEEARKIYESKGFKIASYPKTYLELNDLEIYSRSDFVNLHRY